MKNFYSPIRFVTVTLAFIALPNRAHAHAFLDQAEPKVGSVVDVSPEKVTLHFTQGIQPGASILKVFDSNGKQVDQQDIKFDPNDPSMMTVSLPRLSAGNYKVEWNVTSVDTHKTHGSFNFTVEPKG